MTRISPARGATARPMLRTTAAEAAAVASAETSNRPHKRTVDVVEIKAEVAV